MKPGLSTALSVLLGMLPTHVVLAADNITRLDPWSVGQVLVYETEYLKQATAPGKSEKVRSADTTEIRITQASVDGFVQQWVSRDTRVEVLAGDRAEADMMLAAGKAFEGHPLVVQLARDSTYVGIQNLDETGARLRGALQPLMLAGVDAGIRKNLVAPVDAAKLAQVTAAARAQVEGVMTRLTSAPMLEAMLGQVIQSYNAFVGITLEPGAQYALETELDNPMGGSKFPATLQFHAYRSEDDPDDIFIEWETSIDPKKGLDATWQLVESLYGVKISKADRKQLPRQISLVDAGFILFERGTGVIEMFENTRTTRLGDNLDVSRHRMRLVDSAHGHRWAAESDDQAEAAEVAAAPWRCGQPACYQSRH